MQIKAKQGRFPIFHFSYLILVLLFSSCEAKKYQESTLVIGNARFDQYLPMLKNKRVGLVVNQSAMVSDRHLVDTLISLGVDVKNIFAPEHGFRGEAADGITVEDGIDKKTGIPVLSLYGKNKKPTKKHMEALDVIVFDVQDVGTRFYTYLTTMHWVMEACAAYKIPFIVLDKPNPNGHFVDGPILEMQHKSIIGIHPIPVVHGMTLGEMAKMINEEGWLADDLRCQLTVIPVLGWEHKDAYHLPIRPSPNLPDDEAVKWYPSLCFFEGTIVSVGRGTDRPFTKLGHPNIKDTTFAFVPVSRKESLYPKLEGKRCFGVDLHDAEPGNLLNLSYLIQYYNLLKGGETPYFKKYFTRLAGTEKLQKQIEAGLTEAEIRMSWEEGLQKFKSVRNKYLIYKDNQ